MVSSAAMKRIVWIVGIYLLADFATPGMPGAFVFELKEPVGVAGHYRLLPTPRVPSVPVRPAALAFGGDAIHSDVPAVAMPAALVRRLMNTSPPPLRTAAEPSETDPSPAT
jgi:hypothetical protein